MTSFDKSMRLKGKAEEDRYFAERDRERIEALRANAVAGSPDQHSAEFSYRKLNRQKRLADRSAAGDA